MTANQLQRIKYLSDRIGAIGSATTRTELATIYEIVLAVPSFFPRPGVSFKRYNATKLRKKVCSYCPAKVRPADMEKHVQLVKKQLAGYRSRLEEVLTENNHGSQTEPISVHDLDSTI